ncbi:hypothetical protein IHV25_09190 [Phaeovibrio sulfidiphilus]|uniref:Uncharacterized protein n=1 Tax=Phaeovibrio sulfidiphilus TaxID=1220600 RepID=A0A8J6YNJ7_9PROT|nr:hypothetical protein [Phaeovibrio sulfidiphilus]MBE1237820.1 hypothetical protein [Phaeovibrio sulfidiphilus]
MTFKFRGAPGSLLGEGLIGSRTFLNGPARVAGAGKPATGSFPLSAPHSPALRELAPLCPRAIGTEGRSLFARSLVYALPAPCETGSARELTPLPPRARAVSQR